MLTETDVPDINGRVEARAGHRGVHEALLARGVRADERHELPDAEAHVGEAIRQHFDWTIGIREQAVWSWNGRGLLAPDVCVDHGATWACELRGRRLRCGVELLRPGTYDTKNSSELVISGQYVVRTQMQGELTCRTSPSETLNCAGRGLSRLTMF